MSLQLDGRRELNTAAQSLLNRIGAPGSASVDLSQILPFLPLILGLLPDKEIFAVGGRRVTGAWLKTQGRAALADGKLDAADVVRSVTYFLAIPQEIAVKPLPSDPHSGGASGTDPVPDPVTDGTRPDGLADKGQEAWLEEIYSDWRGLERGADVQKYRDGEVISGPVTLRFMTGMLPQPSWVPSTKNSANAPFSLTHYWRLGDTEVSLSSEADDGSKPRLEIFGTPAGGKGIQMGEHWRNSQGWDVTVTLLPHHAESALPLLYWTVRAGGTAGGTKSNVVRLNIAHA